MDNATFEINGVAVAHTATVRKVNSIFRKMDESAKWPILGRYNVTERAIRNLRKLRAAGGHCDTALEYALALDNEISRIVNAEV